MSNRTTPKDAKSPVGLDLNDMEMIFGTPTSPKNGKPEVHINITNEKNPGKESSPTNNNRPADNGADAPPSTQPLLEPHKDKPIPPLADSVWRKTELHIKNVETA
ncbi:uncharacterized protein LOC114359522 [Ostrinia furnacalis]|uniref:uncharacterized protein LOC114359522 n=1 Tax=Ostrinia furnacalis TaxID=93504 RepID=UPI00103C6A4D|nr:uncharacterized protein LOC114359522 [Ostrinia furnacalis]